ncbi:MAG: peptidylprolyl isomerase [Polyangiaceae bacterium]
MDFRTCKCLAALALAGCSSEPAATSTSSASARATTTSGVVDAPASTSAQAKASTAPSAAPEEVAAQHILIAYKGAKNAPKSVQRSKADAKKLADEVAKKAAAGEDFTSLVKTYSEDEGTKERLGSLGKFKKSEMTPAFSDAAFALAVDAVSSPIETPFGFHIIKRNQ